LQEEQIGENKLGEDNMKKYIIILIVEDNQTNMSSILSSITGITGKDIVTYGSGGILAVSAVKNNKPGMIVGGAGLIYGIFFMDEDKKDLGDAFKDFLEEVWIFFKKILQWIKDLLIKTAQFIGRFIVNNYQSFLDTMDDLLGWVDYFNPFNPYKNYDSSELEKTKQPIQIIAESIDKAIPRHAYDFMRKMRDEEWKMLKNRYYKILNYAKTSPSLAKDMLKSWVDFVKTTRVGSFFINSELEGYIAEKKREIDRDFPNMSRDFPSRVINFYNRPFGPFADIFKTTIFKYCHFQGGLRNENEMEENIYEDYMKTVSTDERKLCEVMTQVDKKFYINLVYHSLLFRDADEGGMNYYLKWGDRLAIIKAIYNSEERKNLVGTGQVQFKMVKYEKAKVVKSEEKTYARLYRIQNGKIIETKEDSLENFVANGYNPKEGNIDDIPDEYERETLKSYKKDPPVEVVSENL